MSKFLKGNYTINKNIVEEENQGKKKKNKFTSAGVVARPVRSRHDSR